MESHRNDQTNNTFNQFAAEEGSLFFPRLASNKADAVDRGAESWYSTNYKYIWRQQRSFQHRA
jgi:hypothetical protein